MYTPQLGHPDKEFPLERQLIPCMIPSPAHHPLAHFLLQHGEFFSMIQTGSLTTGHVLLLA
jgi:hypothetical protein